jgi:hypothetical protein
LFPVKADRGILARRRRDVNYKYVYLKTEDGYGRKFPVRRLVACAFIPRTSTDIKLNRDYVHIKNWSNGEIYAWNLEWKSKTEIMYMDIIRKNDFNKEEFKEIAIKLIKSHIPVSDILKIIDNKLSKEEVAKLKRHCK